MKSTISALMVAVAVTIGSCAATAPAVPLSSGTAPQATFSAQNGPKRVYSNTTHVEAIAAYENAIWVATRGGLEQYDRVRRARIRLYSTEDGLPTLHLLAVRILPTGLPEVVTRHHLCVLDGPTGRFACTPRPPSQVDSLREFRERVEGAPVSAQWTGADGTTWFGTAGLGTWVRELGKLRRVTPLDQIASNHVVAIAEWNQSDWFATFDRGLSRRKDGHFESVPLRSSMLNDIVATSAGLFVATSDGLFSSRDGETFQHEPRVRERAISDLAYDASRQMLYVAAVNSLWELSVAQTGAAPRVTYQPGGSRALQAVDVSRNGTLFLASEDRGALRRVGKRRFVSYDRLAGYPSSWAVDVLALGGRSALIGSLQHGVFVVEARNDVPEATDPWILFLGRDAADPEGIFIGTQGGAIVRTPSSVHHLVGLPNPCVHSMARLSSGLWVGTEGGLAQY